MLQLAEGCKCQTHVINYLNLLLFVTSQAKMYTNGFVLNGLTNGYLTVSPTALTVLSTLSTGAQKLSTACNFFQTACDDFSNAFS